MTSSDMHVPEISRADMTEIFTGINEEHGLSGQPDIKALGPISYVAVNAAMDARERTVTKLVYSPNPEQDAAAAKEDTELYLQLRANGAQLPDIHPDPFIVPSPSGEGGFVGTLFEHLPGEAVAPFQHGRATASLENASEHVDLSRVPVSNGVEEWFMGEAVEYLKGRDTPLVIGSAVMHDELVEELDRQYRRGNEIRDELLYIGRNTKMVVVQEDGHNSNAMGFLDEDALGVEDTPAGLIDILPLRKGLPVVSLARWINDEGPHFRAHPADPINYLAGYVQEVRSHRLPHPAQMQLMADYMQIRTPGSIIGVAVRNHRLGIKSSEWMLKQGITRMLGDRYDPWQPMTDSQKNAIVEGA